MKDSKYIYFLRLDFKKFLILDTLSILFGEKIKEKDLKKEKKKNETRNSTSLLHRYFSS